ncbi:MAG: PEGA domain-containing protein [Candidatus Tectomicrobia bacterium]|nr:PEGA domain-containing protein [Candidatus Tectomicrobia bacterium]MBI2178686.1 PEGA domain-containing protein [Candidatus Tectomicrobia bacterium]
MTKREARRRGRSRRCHLKAAVLALALALLPGALSGCAWWQKNVGKRVDSWVTRRLLIITDPPDADVYVNNVLQGKTPLTLTFKINLTDYVKGFIIVVQKDGYLPLRREVDYSAGTVNLRLIRQQPQRPPAAN